MVDDAPDPFEINRLAWDERVEVHARSALYQLYLERLRAGGVSLEPEHVAALGSVEGRALVQLQCHLGFETLSWARLGAEATGLDFSAPALARAEELGRQLGIEARFVCANVYDAVAALDRRFDVVFVSVGAIAWLPDIRAWAQVVADLLGPGGRLLLQEVHPFGDIFDDHPTEPELVVAHPYFGGHVFDEDEEGTYADLDARFEHTRTLSWIHPLGDVVTALADVGLRIDSLSESHDCMWPRFALMHEVAPDRFELPPPYRDAVPHTYTLAATPGGLRRLSALPGGGGRADGSTNEPESTDRGIGVSRSALAVRATEAPGTPHRR